MSTTDKSAWAKIALKTLEAYETDLGKRLPDDHELGRIDDSRGSPSFRIRVGHIRGLAAAPSPPVSPAEGVVAIKALEWTTEADFIEGRVDGFTQAIIHHGWNLTKPYEFGGERYTSLDDAKAAAQADFEQRVRSCLTASPVSAAEHAAVVAEMDRLRDREGLCPYCNGDGDVHSIDGEWRGVCSCPSGQLLTIRSERTTAIARAEAAEAALAGARESALRDGWNACRRSLYAVCEDVDRQADEAAKLEGEHAKGYAAGMARAAKSIARGFGAMGAMDDDNILALLPATSTGGVK